MSLIDRYVKANITNEEGEVIGQINGVVLDKVSGLKKVEAQRLGIEGRRKVCTEYISVDYYLLRNENDEFIKVEATQVIGYADQESPPNPGIYVM